LRFTKTLPGCTAASGLPEAHGDPVRAFAQVLVGVPRTQVDQVAQEVEVLARSHLVAVADAGDFAGGALAARYGEASE